MIPGPINLAYLISDLITVDLYCLKDPGTPSNARKTCEEPPAGAGPELVSGVRSEMDMT